MEAARMTTNGTDSVTARCISDQETEIRERWERRMRAQGWVPPGDDG
jgi:hypothetical protein